MKMISQPKKYKNPNLQKLKEKHRSQKKILLLALTQRIKVNYPSTHIWLLTVLKINKLILPLNLLSQRRMLSLPRGNSHQQNQLLLSLQTVKSQKMFFRSIRIICQSFLRSRRKENHQLMLQLQLKLLKSRFLNQLRKRLKKNSPKMWRKTRVLMRRSQSLFRNKLNLQLKLNKRLNKNL